jgi:hypothetical protein
LYDLELKDGLVVVKALGAFGNLFIVYATRRLENSRAKAVAERPE